MKELVDASSQQEADTKCNCITHTVHRGKKCLSSEAINPKNHTDFPKSSTLAETHKANTRYSHTQKGNIGLPVHLGNQKCHSTRRTSRTSSLESSNSGNIPVLSVESEIYCTEDRQIPVLEKEIVSSLKSNVCLYEGINKTLAKKTPEETENKHAVVYLHDVFKVKKVIEIKQPIEPIRAHRKAGRMKPGCSKSPKRHSPFRGGLKDSAIVRTIYTKPSSKEPVVDRKKLSDGKVGHNSPIRDSPDSESPRSKKKQTNLAKCDSVLKKIATGREHAKSEKKSDHSAQRELASKKDSPVVDNTNSQKKNIPSGQGDTVVRKDFLALENVHTPKKRGRKPKSTETSPAKGESKRSIETDSNVVTEIVVSPPKGSRKTSKTPRDRKLNKKIETPAKIIEQIDDTPDLKKLSTNSRTRGCSESPSPVRKVRSSKMSPEKESPKSKKSGNTRKSKSVKDLNDNADNAMSPGVLSSVDQVIDDVASEHFTNELKKSPPSPRKPKKPNSPERKMTATTKDKTPLTKDKKSPKKTPQENESCSVEKMKTPPSSNSGSAKKEKTIIEPKPGVSGVDLSASRALDFNSDISKLILDSSKLPFPSDFQYKYTSSGLNSGPVALTDLISKINSSMNDSDDNLTAMFGKTEEPDYYSDEKSLSPTNSDINVSTDSDKTIIECVVLNESNSKTDICLKDETSGSDNITKGDVTEGENVAIDENCNIPDIQENNTSDKDNEINIAKQHKEHEDSSKVELFEYVDSDETDVFKKQVIEDMIDVGKGIEDGDLTYDSHATETDPDHNDEKIEDANDNMGNNEQSPQETISVFEMFGLTLKRRNSKTNCDNNEEFEQTEDSSLINENECDKEKLEVDETNEKENILCKQNTEVEDDDVMFLSETKVDSSIVILSEDDVTDRTSYESLKGSLKEKVKHRFSTVANNVVQPTSLEILTTLEKANSKKDGAFVCSELDEYLDVNKELCNQLDNENKVRYEKNGSGMFDVKDELKKVDPDFDEIEGHIFVSFASEFALKAHVSLEKKVDWLTEAQLKKMAHLKQMKERQNDLGSRRITDVKLGDEQKQNFRGIPMRLMKYQKMLKQELEDILLSRPSRSPEKSPSKSPTKTTDITKIKGWKSKFQNQEEMQEATGINISESGKVHWRTEERLVKNLDPKDIKDIGLDLKKKRRKLVSYSNKRRSSIAGKPDKRESEMMEYEYEIDDLAITESDVYNEDDDKPPPEKIPYNVKYLSQHKYGARKLFVKRMKLDVDDERILQKLGTLKLPGNKSDELLNTPNRHRQVKHIFALSKLTHAMAVAAVSALDKKLLNKAKGLEKAETTKRRKKEAMLTKKEGRAVKQSEPEVEHEKSDDDLELEDEDETFEDVLDHAHTEHDRTFLPEKDEAEEYSDVDKDDDDVVEEENEQMEDKESVETKENVLKTTRDSSSDRTACSRTKSGSNDDVILEEEDHGKTTGDLHVKIPQESSDACTQPGPFITELYKQFKDCNVGCRYGCICHLCKLSDSGEEKEPDFKPPCDKEYCRLGCICESIDTKSAEEHHCRKPGCMFECKCPPKQAKPDIPRERDRGKRKRVRGGKKKRTPEKMEYEADCSIKEEDTIICEDNDWEPTSKRKRGTSNSRFANLPKRETTYRLAKNLDAVSRKAMEVYASSEMFTEQKVRRRRSDQGMEDSYFLSPEMRDSMDRSRTSSVKQDVQLEPILNEETGVLEISDSDSDTEVYPEDFVSCSRIQPYVGPYKSSRNLSELKKDFSKLNKRKGGLSGRKESNIVIDLVDSDNEDNTREKDQSHLPSTSGCSKPQSLTEKMGLTGKTRQKDTKQDQDIKVDSKWKTQMVCLKAKKKSDDKLQDPRSEIKLLEIMSNCNWEIDRTNMLSKISHIISKETLTGQGNSQFISWGAYLLEFLPKAFRPAVIPPELKSKLPSEMFSIRIKVTKNYISKNKKLEQTIQDRITATIDIDDSDGKSKELTDDEKKSYNMRLQKKLIDKIKFAERLRNLIIGEEQKGVTPSKFSVSRDGIEKALKKYKTQLWKAYTGNSNFTIQQLKQALHAAKSNAESGASTSDNNSRLVSTVMSTSTSEPLSLSTMARIHTNQGVNVKVCTNSAAGQTAGHFAGSFINLGNLQSVSTSVTTLVGGSAHSGNIVIHQALPAASLGLDHGTARSGMKRQGLIDNAEFLKTLQNSSVATTASQGVNTVSTSELLQMSTGNITVSAAATGPPDMVLVPLDKNINPNHLPPGSKLAVMQPVNRVGSPVPLSILPPGFGQCGINAVVLPNSTQKSILPVSKPMLNPALSALAISSVNGEPFRPANPIGIVSTLAGPMNVIRQPAPASSIQSSGSVILMNGTSAGVRPGFIRPQFVASVTLPSSSNMSGSGILPLKNISNIPPVMSSGGPGDIFTAANGCSMPPGGIYPIRFANESSHASSKMHVAIPPHDMIGFPKVTSLPFKLLNLPAVNTSDQKQMLLMPVTSSVMPITPGTNKVSVSKVVNAPVMVSEVGTGSLVSSQSLTRPLLSAVPASVMSADASIDKEVNQSTTTTARNQSPGLADSYVQILDEINPETDETKVTYSECGINKIPDSILVESDDNGDIDSLASSTRSLSSLSDLMKTDANVLEVKLATAQISDENMCIKQDAQGRNNCVESEDITGLLGIANTAGIEIANALGSIIDNTGNGESVSISVAKVVNKGMNETNPDCVVLDDTDEDCLVIAEEKAVDKNERAQENVMKPDKLENYTQNLAGMKRKRKSPYLSDDIYCERTMKKTKELLERMVEMKRRGKDGLSQGEQDPIRIDDSEDSDVDIMMCDTAEPTVKPTLPNKRKFRQKVISNDNDLHIRKYQDEETQEPVLEEFVQSKTMKMTREKFRRNELRMLFDHMENVVLKYNQNMRSFHGIIPKHMILQEAQGLLSALKQKNGLLRECMEDGQQYAKTLQTDLQQQIDSFVKSGVPEAIIKNFLKSVEKSILPMAPKRKRKAPVNSDSEDNDTGLEFEMLTPDDVRIKLHAVSNETTDGNTSLTEVPQPMLNDSVREALAPTRNVPPDLDSDSLCEIDASAFSVIIGAGHNPVAVSVLDNTNRSKTVDMSKLLVNHSRVTPTVVTPASNSSISSVPMNICNVPVNVCDVPMNVGHVPVKLGNVPMNIGNVPVKVGNVPMNIGHVPVKVGNVPMNIGHVPVKVGNVPMNIGNVPVKVGNVPMNVGHVPLKVGNVPMNVGHVQVNVGSVPVNVGNGPMNVGNVPMNVGIVPLTVGNVPVTFCSTDAGVGTAQGVFNIVNSQDIQSIKAVNKQKSDNTASQANNELKISQTIPLVSKEHKLNSVVSSTNNVTPGERSPSDYEIGCSTGDPQMSHDSDFMQSEHGNEFDQSEELLQNNDLASCDTISQSEMVS